MSVVCILDRRTGEPACYAGWPDWRREVLRRSRIARLARTLPASMLAPPGVSEGPVWRPCGLCWGQGRHYAADLSEWRLCGGCLGVGQVPSVPA